MIRRILFRNFKFIYNLDRWVSQRFTLMGLMLMGGLVGSAIFGIDTKQNLAHQLFSFLLALLLLSFLFSLIFKLKIKIKRDLPKFASVDKPIQYKIYIYNQSNRTEKYLFIQEQLQQILPSFQAFVHSKEPGYEKRTAFDKYIGYPRWVWLMTLAKGAQVNITNIAQLSAYKQIEINMTLKPLRRGYIYFTHAKFSKADPLGLFKAFYTIKQADALLVLPKRYPVQDIQLPGFKQYQRGGVELAVSVGAEDEFISLREYRPGDSPRHMHWKSFAKLSKPVVKEYQDEFFVRHALILDTFIQEIASEQFEAAVSVAASIVAAEWGEEVLLDLMFAGVETYHFTAGRGVGNKQKLLEVLACIQPCLNKEIKDLLPLVQQHIHQLSGCILILLDYQEHYQELIDFLKQKGVTVKVILVSKKDIKFKNIDHVIHPDHIAEDLQAL